MEAHISLPRHILNISGSCRNPTLELMSTPFRVIEADEGKGNEACAKYLIRGQFTFHLIVVKDLVKHF